jgi:hypothetical protein
VRSLEPKVITGNIKDYVKYPFPKGIVKLGFSKSLLLQLLDKAFPSVPYSENKHINVKGEKSPYDGDLTYWSERNSKLYDDNTSRAIKQ